MRYRITNLYIQKPSDCKSAESGGRLDVKKRQKHYRMKNNSYICNANPQTPPLTSHNSGSNFGTHYRMNQTILITL